MPRYLFAVHTNPVEGREDEYNSWYSDVHLADVLKVAGVVSARRFRLAGPQVTDKPQPFHYLAVYEVDTDDPQSFMSDLLARAGTEALPVVSALSPINSAVLWEPLT